MRFIVEGRSFQVAMAAGRRVLQAAAGRNCYKKIV